MTSAGMLWAALLIAGVGAASALTVRAVETGRSPWPAVVVVWAGLAFAGHVASGRPAAAKSALIAATLTLPVAVAAIVARAQLRVGRRARRAGGVAFVLGTLVAAFTPVIQLFLLCAVAHDCL